MICKYVNWYCTSVIMFVENKLDLKKVVKKWQDIGELELILETAIKPSRHNKTLFT